MLRVGKDKPKDAKDDPKDKKVESKGKETPKKPSGPPQAKAPSSPPAKAPAGPPAPPQEVPMDDPMAGGAPPPEMMDPAMAGGLPKVSADKLDQAIVVYMTSDMGPFACGACAHFEGPNSCGVVDGEIDPAGLCNVFTPPMVAAPEMTGMEPQEAPMPEEPMAPEMEPEDPAELMA